MPSDAGLVKRPRLKRRLLLGAALVLFAVTVFLAWSAWSARVALLEARSVSVQLRTALTAGDQVGATVALARLQDEAATARSRTSGWDAFGALPVIGDDLAAVRTLAVSLDDIATHGLPGLVDRPGIVDGSALMPKHGRMDTRTLGDLQAPIHDAATTLGSAVERLQAIDAAGLIPQLRGPFTEARDDLVQADQALDSAARAVDVLPSMLGAGRPRTWLLVFQNNAEMRGTGGLPGAVTVVRTDRGRISQVRQAVGNRLGHSERAVLALTPFEKKFYGPLLGRYFLDANLSPDFPRAAELMRAWWQAGGGEQIDGIIALDPVTLSYLLEATGPIAVEGGELTAANAIEVLLHEVYFRYPDPADQDVFLADVASRVFDAIVGGRGDASGLVRALTRGVGEHRVFVHSFAADEQRRIAGTGLSGELRTELDGPRVDIALNDATGAKMQYFLRYDVDVRGRCVGTTQAYDVTMHVASRTPPNVLDLPDYVTGGNASGTPIGSQTVLVDVFGPAGGTVGGFDQDGVEFPAFTVTASGRQVAQVPLELGPGEESELHWTMTASPGGSGDTQVTVTPGVERESESSIVPESCVATQP